MKFATLNDLHFGIRNDAGFMLDYQERFYRDFFFPILIEQKVFRIKIGGDLVDRRKYINYNSSSRMKDMLFRPALELGIEIDVFPGNHDVAFKNTNKVNSLEELLGGFENVNIIGTPIVQEHDGVRIMMVPWINGENKDEFLKFIEENDADILYGHLELSGFETHKGSIRSHGMKAELFSKFPEVWSGHFHHQSKKGNIHYLGSPMEFTWNDYGDARGFHIYDTETKHLTFYQNPFILHEKIFYHDETLASQEEIRKTDFSKFDGKILRLFVQKKTNNALFEWYAEQISKRDVVDFSILEDFSEFKSDNVEILEAKTETKDLIFQYIEKAETDKDKERLKGLFEKFYVEALHARSSG